VSDDLVVQLDAIETESEDEHIAHLCGKASSEIAHLTVELAARDELLREARAWIVEGKVDFDDGLADRIDAALAKGGDNE
jgi:hypothetical protein